MVKLGGLTLRGFVAWMFWGIAHVYFLIGLRNRIAVAFSWAWDYITFGRRARLITEPADGRPAESQPAGPSGQPSAASAAVNAGTRPERGGVWG